MRPDRSPALPRSLSTLERADIAIALYVAARRHHPAMRLAAAVNDAGDQPPLLAFAAAVLAYGLMKRDRRAAVAGRRMLGSLLVSIVIKTALKAAVSRTRPNVLLDDGRYAVRLFGPNTGPWQSFPSGHTAGTVAVARALAQCYPRARPLACAAAGAVALVQVPRGTHFPLDVVAGLAVGLLSDALAKRLDRKAGVGDLP